MPKSNYLDNLHKAQVAHKKSMHYLMLSLKEARKSADLATVKALEGLIADIDAEWRHLRTKIVKAITS
jgi:hypothetical protein